MRAIELSPRLRSVANLVPQGARFADIGTDHAYLPVWLLQQGTIKSAIAADLRAGPLERARQNAARHRLTEYMDFRLCSGLAHIRPQEVDTIAIAGMGGETIADILADAPWTKQGQYRLILQPMSAHEDLRLFLQQAGYTVIEEIITKEGDTLYITLHVQPGFAPLLTPAESWAGRQQCGQVPPLRMAYLTALHVRAARAIDGLRKSSRATDIARLATLEEVYAGLNTMIEECRTWQQ